MANLKLKEREADIYVICLYDEFIWEDYKAQVDKIMKSSGLLSVTWDLSHLTYVPWQHVWKQIALMRHYRPIMAQHIKKNIIILPNKKWKHVLDLIFKIVPPVAPTILQY